MTDREKFEELAVYFYSIGEHIDKTEHTIRIGNAVYQFNEQGELDQVWNTKTHQIIKA